MHARRAILQAIRAQLKTIPGMGGVWIQRVPPVRIIWPCLTLAADNENVETLTIHAQPRQQDRIITVSINCWIRGTPDDEKVEADMDAAAVLIEQAMNSDFGADNCQLIATDFRVGEEEPEIHQLVLTYQLSYTTTESNPVT